MARAVVRDARQKPSSAPVTRPGDLVLDRHPPDHHLPGLHPLDGPF
jgi:hypothetical protein